VKATEKEALFGRIGRPKRCSWSTCYGKAALVFPAGAVRVRRFGDRWRHGGQAEELQTNAYV
jgi:hypothetical protein